MVRYRSLALFLLLAVAPGCGGPRYEPVSGIVTYQGKPVEGATINFIDEANNASAYGLTDASGRFTLTTKTPGDGAPAGSYKVTISKVVTTGGEVKEIAPGVLDPNPKIGKTTYAVPQKYGNATTSGLTAQVAAGNKNEFTFDLK